MDEVTAFEKKLDELLEDINMKKTKSWAVKKPEKDEIEFNRIMDKLGTRGEIILLIILLLVIISSIVVLTHLIPEMIRMIKIILAGNHSSGCWVNLVGGVMK